VDIFRSLVLLLVSGCQSLW